MQPLYLFFSAYRYRGCICLYIYLYVALQNRHYKVDYPYTYKILYKESLNKEKLQLFIRGIKFEINNFDSIKEFIDEINKGISIKVKDILSFLNKDWDSEIGLYILSILYKHNGINVTKN